MVLLDLLVSHTLRFLIQVAPRVLMVRAHGTLLMLLLDELRVLLLILLASLDKHALEVVTRHGAAAGVAV